MILSSSALLLPPALLSYRVLLPTISVFNGLASCELVAGGAARGYCTYDLLQAVEQLKPVARWGWYRTYDLLPVGLVPYL